MLRMKQALNPLDLHQDIVEMQCQSVGLFGCKNGTNIL
nr:MAG TPA: hypothetical protein [Caudoviricetes sp.]